MLKKAKVHLIATNQKANIFYAEGHDYFHSSFQQVATTIISDCKGFHLYITTDEEIKEGDWFICDEKIYQSFGYNELKQIMWGKTQDMYLINSLIKKKIIVSTDSSLGLPRPSDSFIAKYVESYNKGKVITDVMVEYEERSKFIVDKEKRDDPKNGFNYNKIKVNPKDNTITIKPIKDSWSRDEVISLLDELCNDLEHRIDGRLISDEDYNKWKGDKL